MSFWLLLLGWRTWRLSENLNFKFKVFFWYSPACVSYRALHRREPNCTDDERARHWKPEQILAETTHKCNAFSTSPERFITVIKVLFANTLQRKVSPHVRTVSSTEDKSQPDFCRALERRRLTSFCFFSFCFYQGGHRQTRIISSNRLRAGNKLLHLSMKMIEQKDDKRRAAHLSKLFTRGAKSQLLDPLEKLLCYSYNLSLTCCIYWITDLSAACQGTFNMSIITTGLNYSGVSCLCWTSPSITRQVGQHLTCKGENRTWLLCTGIPCLIGYQLKPVFCFLFFSCFAQNAARWAMQPAQLHLGSTLTVTWWRQSKHFQSAATFTVRDPHWDPVTTVSGHH